MSLKKSLCSSQFITVPITSHCFQKLLITNYFLNSHVVWNSHGILVNQQSTNKTLCVPGARRKEQCPHKTLSQTFECREESPVEAWVNSLASGQTTGREHNPTHQQKIGLKIYPPSRTRPTFPKRQFLPSGSFHKPLILIHQRADRMKTTITEN